MLAVITWFLNCFPKVSPFTGYWPMTVLPSRRQIRIVVIGPFPPPHNGAAKNTLLWAESFTSYGFQVIKVETNVPTGSAHNRSFRYHIDRLNQALRNSAVLLRVAGRESIVYIVPDGGMGLVYNLLYAAILRLRRVRRIWMHHRNFHNIRTGSILLRFFSILIGSGGRHIFLTEKMRSTFEAQIGPARQSEVISNAANCDVDVVLHQVKIFDPSRALTIGFLSNLNIDKGFDIAARAFMYLSSDEPKVRFLVGGDPSTQEAATWAKQLSTVLGERVEMLGHIAGHAKSNFFRSVDIFIFPTTYKLEAQPNVLMEALATGASIVATDHACISETLTGTHHRLIALDDRAVMAQNLAEGVRMLINDMRTPEDRNRVAQQNVDAFVQMRRIGIASYRGFMQRMSDGANQ